MPFQIIRNDITKVKADAIVNTANPKPAVGRGTDTAVYEAAGWEQLIAEREKIGIIERGKAACTPAFDLPARYIIHTVGPKWIDGDHGEEETLRSCYSESLKIAEDLDCESIAFPLLASGNYHFPKELAIKTATSVIYDYLMGHDMMVYLVVYDDRAFDLSGKLFSDVRDYLGGSVEDTEGGAYDVYGESDLSGAYGENLYHKMQKRPGGLFADRIEDADISASATLLPDELLAAPSQRPPAPAPSAAPKQAKESLRDQLGQTQESFPEHLMQLIIERDLKNSDVYHGANISKQVFSKILSKPDYHPTKNTICALAISLHLDVDEANDLLEKAGMILSGSSRFDIAVRYFLEHGMYNIVEDNIILYDNQLEPLGQQ